MTAANGIRIVIVIFVIVLLWLASRKKNNHLDMVFWLINVLVFAVFVLLRANLGWFSEVESIDLNIWSNAIRLHVIFLFIGRYILMDWTTFLSTLLVAGIMAIPGILAYRKGHRKEEADAVSTYEDVAGRAATRALKLQERLIRMEEEIQDLKDTNDALRKYIYALLRQLANNGIIPNEPSTDLKLD